MKCQYCEKDVSLPFKCPFCGRYFCADHRLPENHACTELWKVKVRPVSPVEPSHTGGLGGEVEAPKPAPEEYPVRVEKGGWTSGTEVYHLAIGALTVTAVGLSMSGGLNGLSGTVRNPAPIVGSALLFMFIFISHELAHKMSAKHFGMWAEFRLSLLGVVLTVLSILSPLIKIISPGAVMISGVADKRTIGKIAFAGPLANIILALFFYVATFQIHSVSLAIIFLRGASLSAWMSAFNLIPVGIFDGAKIFWWNKHAWAASFVFSTILSVVTILTMISL